MFGFTCANDFSWKGMNLSHPIGQVIEQIAGKIGPSAIEGSLFQRSLL